MVKIFEIMKWILSVIVTFLVTAVCVLFAMGLQLTEQEAYKRSNLLVWQAESLNPDTIQVLEISHHAPSGRGSSPSNYNSFLLNLLPIENEVKAQSLDEKTKQAMALVYHQKALRTKSNIPFQSNRQIYYAIRHIQLLSTVDVTDKNQKKIYYFVSGEIVSPDLTLNGKQLVSNMLPQDSKYADKTRFRNTLLITIWIAIGLLVYFLQTLSRMRNQNPQNRYGLKRINLAIVIVGVGLLTLTTFIQLIKLIT